MIERIINFSVRRRWLVLLITLAAAAYGFWSLTKLPIDAVPDVTNVQVQVNAVAPALTPVEIENRSEERRVGKECCLVCRSRWSPYH